MYHRKLTRPIIRILGNTQSYVLDLLNRLTFIYFNLELKYRSVVLHDITEDKFARS